MNELSADHDTARSDETGAYRSGVAARLAGLPVETLRVWERRYGVSTPQRSARGQRLYSSAQVRRLSLIKQLVDQGHPIGAMAHLPLEQLQHLAEPLNSDSGASGPIRVAVVGAGLARQLTAGARDRQALDVRHSCARLEDAPGALHGVDADVLLIELSELDDAALPLVAAARLASGTAAVVVLYRFCASATIRHLRALGCLVARAPSDMAEVALLCQVAFPARRAQLAAASRAPLPPAGDAPAPAPRRLDDQALAALAAASNSVACECPRHLAEILLMIGSFERYSLQCGARNPADAALHQDLGQAAAQARTLLESALERLARAEGLPLPQGLA
ncbi:MerR family transcriptional regulator [Massilia atriviolacea]|uniref:MerR family transcriptional regulator n=1 Tax=Massilia atriviolacea TaxID=2495579 RepID=A0A430HH89_9BURK|nr:MerR family transcriptional regulator [Massilia atriviolacea]RSZ56885.1 MerR family transcriptional regulator [Massilia atriviolacea]